MRRVIAAIAMFLAVVAGVAAPAAASSIHVHQADSVHDSGYDTSP
jgi:hypothetical protein